MKIVTSLLMAFVLGLSALYTSTSIDDLLNNRNAMGYKVAFKSVRMNRKLKRLMPVGQKPVTLTDIFDQLKKITEEKNIRLLSMNQDDSELRCSLEMPANEKLRLEVKKGSKSFNVQMNASNDKIKRKLRLKASEPLALNDFNRFVKHHIKQITTAIRKLEDDPVVGNIESFLLKAKESIKEALLKASSNNPGIAVSKVDQHYVVSLNDKPAFDIFLKAFDAQTELVVTNVPKKSKFGIFDNSHFEFRRLYEDKDDGLSDFADKICREIWPKIQHLDDKTSFNRQILSELISLLPEYDFRIEKHADIDKDNYIFIEVARKSKTRFKDKILEFHITRQPDSSLYNFYVSQSETTFELTFSDHNRKEQLAKSKNQIREILTKAEATLYNLPKIIAKFSNYIKKRNTNCKLDTQSLPESVNYNYVSYTLPDNIDCVLEKTTVTLTLFHYGYNRSLHLSFENDFLIQEFAISINDRFISNLLRAIDQVYAEVNAEKKIRQSKKNPTEVSSDDMAKAVGKLANKYKYKCRKYGNGYMCSKQFKFREEVVLMVKELNASSKKKKYFKVNLINPLSENEPKQGNYAHSEIIIDANNGSSQLVKMESKADDFMHKIDQQQKKSI